MAGEAGLTAADLADMAAMVESTLNATVELLALASGSDAMGDALTRTAIVLRTLPARWVDKGSAARYLADRKVVEFDQALVLPLGADLSNDPTNGKLVAFRNPASGRSFTRVGDNLDRSNRDHTLLLLKASDLRGILA